jgi:hypothetical protein
MEEAILLGGILSAAAAIVKEEVKDDLPLDL